MTVCVSSPSAKRVSSFGRSIQLAATLNGLTKLKILGDFTKAGEGIAIDDVSITASETQPAFPVSCQQVLPLLYYFRCDSVYSRV